MMISLLQQMYRDVLAGTPLAEDSHQYSSLLTVSVEQPPGNESCRQRHLPPAAGGAGSPQDTDVVLPAADDSWSSSAPVSSSLCPREVTLLQLTLIKMLVAKAGSQPIESSMRQKYREILVLLLLQEAKTDSKLVSLFSPRDRLLSHMASQSLASLVYFQLKEENALNGTWLSFTLNALLGFPGNTPVADCLWTLAAIIREILKDAVLPKAGVLKKLLAPLDAVLEGFYNAILFHHFDSHHYTSPYSEAATNLISFIDLLEALLSSRTELELPLGCQRVLFLKVSYVLNLISSAIPYVIKKKLILLLKKCVLHKSGEEAGSGSVSLRALPGCEDMLALSNAVLQGGTLTWLYQIPLHEKSSYFGSSEPAPGDDPRGGSDQTALRALSLVVLKALEFKIHNSTAEAEIKGDFESSMSQLLMFWRSHLKPFPQSHPIVHPCEWLSLIFIEQDDDMWEAAKALLLIYLKLDRLRHDAAANLSQEEEDSWNSLTHAGGYNPHCIFLSFLEKIAFDSSVLLDFLISSETCFLEYLVRYLKLLGREWHCLVAVCSHFDPKPGPFGPLSPAEPPPPAEQSCGSAESWRDAFRDPAPQTALCSASSRNCCVFSAERGDNERGAESPTSAESAALPRSLQSLLHYHSSEGSELESDGEESLGNTKEVPANKEGETRRRGTAADNWRICPADVLPVKQEGSHPSSCLTRVTPLDNIIPLRVMLYKSTKCLEELQQAISRLQRRNLFPYNPTALLKLLSHVEKMSKNMDPQ